jgi:dipeptidyl aminopeptidase/acylaminoacyl peptidase
VGEEGRNVQLFIRDLDGYGTRAVPGTMGARFPFLSPDGERVGFFVDGLLRTVSAAGGIPIDLVDAARLTGLIAGDAAGGSWGADGTIVFSMGSRLWRVDADGGAEEEIVLVAADASLERISDPYILPGSESALASALWVPADSSESRRRVSLVIDLATGEARPLLELPDPSGLSPRPRYVRPGYIVAYNTPGTLVVAPFDLARGEITGPVIPVVDDALRPAGSTAVFSASESGTLVYAPGGLDRELVIVERNGRENSLDVTARGYRFPDVSPDGRHVAVSIDPVPSELWVLDIVSGTERPIKTEGNNIAPKWSPQGARLAWQSSGVQWLSWPAAAEINLVEWNVGDFFEWITEDELLVDPAQGRFDIGVLDLTTGEVRGLVVTPARESQARLSPDGAWVAYESDATGVAEVWVTAFDGSSPGRQVSSGGGTEPHWSFEGTELLFRSGSAIWVAAVRTTPTFEVLTTPSPLFPAPYDFSNDNNWDVLPDGRFLMIRGNPDVGREIRVMTGWIDRVVAN